ncbi:hypothetical protein [Nocardioides sp. LS1]|uniref:hypothetical protein n=1 Tax=Nocardioides sp. LS1 TaxID=1027620 RepID=UPI000F623B8F|nr:hypothetical protein [Nocardioides sp. LS1]
MTEQQRDNSQDAPKSHQGSKTGSRLKRLSAAEIARRAERQRPAIARAGERGRTARPARTDEQPELETPPAVDAPEGAAVVVTHPAVALTTKVDGDDNGAGPLASIARSDVKTAMVSREASQTGPRQMTIWETAEDAEVIEGWVAASTRRDRLEDEADTEEAGDTEAGGGGAVAGWRVVTPCSEVDPAVRRTRLRNLTTRDDLHLVQQVRAAVLDLVLEHPHQSGEADRRLVALGIRFGVWTLAKTADGEFDPFRDLTEDRITRFVRDAGPHLSPGSRDSYAAALRRLAAGPTIRHRSSRREAAAPLPRAVEDGLWAAADAYAVTSRQHTDAKTLLALSFGAGAMAEEINIVAPEDVLVGRHHGDIRVSVRLVRDKTWVRDVPVLQSRYADWLAARATQVAGHAYLFKPDRVSRRNALNSTTRRLAETNRAFERFRLNAARNTWAVTWLRAGVPFAEWANAAGVGPGTHLPTDLLAHLPTPGPDQVEAAFRCAALRTDPTAD